MSAQRSEKISRFLTRRTLHRLLRVSAGVLVWSALASVDTSHVFGQAEVFSCCESGGGTICVAREGSSQNACQQQNGTYFEGAERYRCTDGAKCCPISRFCNTGSSLICCPVGQACIKRQCCPIGTPQVCGGVCCPPGETQCDKNNKCCKPTAQFQITAVRSGPPVQMDITIHNPANGIGEITCRKLINATMDMPYFPPGTKDPIVATFTKIDPKLPSQVELASCTVDGCCQNGDPVLTVLRIPRGRARVRESFSQIPAAERFVSVQNGNPGLQRLHVFVNGRRVRILQLSDEKVQTIDIAAHMAPQNIITLVGQGPEGSSALVYIADMPGLPNASRMPYHVDWDPGLPPEEVNMSWGN